MTFTEQDVHAAFLAGAAWATCNPELMKPTHPNFKEWLEKRKTSYELPQM